MTERAPYSRVYWSVMDDPKFRGIYEDDASFSCWVRLLMMADAIWPQAPHIPRSTKKRALEALVAAGIVTIGTGHRYRIVGLDAERERRKVAATRAATGTQLGPKRDPDGFEVPGLSQAKPSQEEPSLAEDIVDDYYRLTNRFPSGTVKEWLDRLSNEFGYEQASRELAKQYGADPSTRTLLGRVENELKSDRHIATRKEALAERSRLEAEARAKDITPEQAADNKRRLDEIYAQWFPKEAA
jgi:hypothetical protein